MAPKRDDQYATLTVAEPISTTSRSLERLGGRMLAADRRRRDRRFEALARLGGGAAVTIVRPV
jgi:hypothetical protein